MRTRITATAISAAALLALSACSSSNSDDKSTTAATGPTAAASTQHDDSNAGLTKAVADYTALLFEGNPAGYKYLSARCKREMSHDEWTQLAKQGHHDYGSQKATGIHIDELSGDLARVTYGAGNIPAMVRKAQPWAREDGIWRWDACQATS